VVRTGSGPPLLCVVGLGGRAAFWMAQMTALAPDVSVIAFEYDGRGGDPAYRGDYSVRTLAEVSLGLLDALEIPRATILGHSMGANSAQHMAVFAPDRVEALVLSAGWPGPSPLLTELFELRRSVLLSCGPEAYLLLGAVLGTPGWRLQEQFTDRAAFLAERLKGFVGTETELQRLDGVMSHDLRARLGEIRAPTLSLWMRDDQITPPGLSAELAALIPGAEGIELPEGGHFAPATVPERYNAAVAGFLRARR
jgi:aminoacrylate hydrolase